MKRIKAKGIKIIVYEPILKEDNFFGSDVVRDLEIFMELSDLIVCNHLSAATDRFSEKVFTRDIFGID